MRYAARLLAGSPGFTAVVVLSIGLGIGANATIFSVANALLIRPLPIDESHRVVTVLPGSETTSYVDYRYYREHNQVLDGLAAHASIWLNLQNGAGAERVFGQIVTGNYFSVLGVRPALGRTFLPEEDATPRTHPVTVLSDSFWRSRFNADPAIVGRDITINGRRFTVIGVAPKAFTGTVAAYAPGMWVPMMMQADVWPGEDRLVNRQSTGLTLLGRLKDGVDDEQARLAFEGLRRRLDAESVSPMTSWGFAVVERAGSVYFRVRDGVYSVFALLFAVVGLLLLIASSNVAGVLVARASTRRRELALRAALGATRGQLLRQLLAENMLLWVLGGGVGLAIAQVASALLTTLQSRIPVPVEIDLGPAPAVVGFALALSLLTGLIFGLAPALTASRPLMGSLKDDVGDVVRVGTRRFTLRHGFVVAQAALSCVLLIGAGLLIASLRNATTIDPGFETGRGIVTSVALSTTGYPEARQRTYYDTMLQRTIATPGVSSASLALVVPLSLENHAKQVFVDARPAPTSAIAYNVVGPGYFETLGIPVVNGRGILDRDGPDDLPVVVINETMARQVWPGENPIGKRLRQWDEHQRVREVIGVVRDARFGTLGGPPEPYLFIPFRQEFQPDMHLHVRTAGVPAAVLGNVRRAVQEIDSSVAVETRLLTDHLGLAFLLPQAGAGLLSGFGLVGLLLACLGIFGLVSQDVNRRQREIGIRMAIGARAAHIVRLVLGRTTGLVAMGLAAGVAGALAFTRLLAGFLYGVSVADPAVFATTVVAMLIAAGAASLIPVRRALKLDPVIALRRD